MLAKLARLVAGRPVQIWPTFRGYVLFVVTGLTGQIYFTRRFGIILAPNVRIQRLRCVFAERPGAEIQVGEDTIIYENARIEAYGRGRVVVGRDSVVGDARICSRASISIGDRFVTSWNVFIQDFDPHPIDPDLRGRQISGICGGFRPGRSARDRLELEWDFPVAPIVIGKDVWIGANVTVLKGVQIGDGCVVATGAVVPAGIYPPRSVIAGVPAKVVKTLA